MFTSVVLASRRPGRLALLALTALASIASLTATAEARDRYFDVRRNFADERVVGPAFVHIAGMDPFLTPWSVGVKGTAIAPPDISFITSKPAPGAAGIQAAANVRAAQACDPTNSPVACIDNLAVATVDVTTKITAAADSEQGVQRRSTRYVHDAGDLSKANNLDAYRTLIKTCVLEDSSGAVCPTAAPGLTEKDRVNALKDVRAADAAYRDTTQLYTLIAQSQGFNDAKDSVKARVTALKTALDAAKTQLDAVDKFGHDTLEPLSISQYVYDNDVSCNALFNGGREKQLTLTLGTSDTRDVTVVCPTPVFVSLGLATDGLRSRTFTTVAANTAGQPAPVAGATPQPSVITENDKGSRVLAQTMLHIGLGSPSDDGSGLAYSLGIGVPVFTGGGGSVDLLTGLSYAYRRTAVVTAGVAFGKSLDLAPGYVSGGPITPGTSPPTLNRYASAFYVGVSFAR